MHDQGCLTFTQVLSLDNEVEKFASFAISTDHSFFSKSDLTMKMIDGSGYLLEYKEANIVPLPNLMQLNNIRVVLQRDREKLDRT